MKTNWNFLKAGALLIALPLMATAAVSASQWVNDTTPIELGAEASVLEKADLGVARVHTVALSASGAFEGRVATVDAAGATGLAGLDVYFMRNGNVVQETTTSADGVFRVEGLAEGNYSFVASGENGFAAYGVRVVGETAGVENVMEAAAIGKGVAAAKQILDSNAATTTQEFATASNSGDLVGANRVNLVDGNLTGSVKSLVGANVEGSQVYILSGDKQIAEATTDANGNFKIADMAPGFYNFVASGPSGIAAVSFEAINVEVSNVEIPVSFKPVTLQDFGYGNSLDVYTTTGSDVAYTNSDISYEPAAAYQEFAPVEYASESIACGGSCGAACGSTGNFSNYSSGCCGGAGGGGIGGRLFGGGGGLLGGGGGLGRLGRIALLSGAVVGIVAIADDNAAGESSPTE